MHSQSIILEELKNVLYEVDEQYFINEKMDKMKIIKDFRNYNKDLLSAVINNDMLNRHFSTSIQGTVILKIESLIRLIEADTLWKDSYTNYVNSIGLTSGGDFLTQNQSVVLDFPYKDSVLKAGMTKEDVAKEDAEEQYYHELVHLEEIDRMYDSKLLVNAKRYSSEGVLDAVSFDDEDNLILKGNNLIALHSLKDRYAGKVKLIYLDPPYYFDNPADGSFAYNTDFQLSTWLVFIKNRIEIALDLLKEDGYLAIQSNDTGVFHLKVLLDDIFGNLANKGGFINDIIVKMSDLSGPKMAHVTKKVPKIKEHILLYAKNVNLHQLNPQREPSDWDKSIDSKRYTSYVEKNNSLNPEDWEYTTVRKKLKSIGLEYGSKEAYEFLINNSENVYRTAANSTLTKISKKNKFNRNVFTPVITGSGMDKYVYKDEEVIFASSKIVDINNVLTPTESISDVWMNIALNDLSNEGGSVDLKNGKKPEALIKQLIELTTNENDLVLDFFMGTATTQATSLKLNRQFIGIEQMDYIEDKSVKRLLNAINGENRGISRAVNWAGGGSFVYAELMPKSRGYIDSIGNAETYDDLRRIYKIMLDSVSVNFKTDLERLDSDLNEQIRSLSGMKDALLAIIDKNQLYYNYSEIDDQNVRDLISDTDYKFNKVFYEGEGTDG